jgi:hypothetical protein
MSDQAIVGAFFEDRCQHALVFAHENMISRGDITKPVCPKNYVAWFNLKI